QAAQFVPLGTEGVDLDRLQKALAPFRLHPNLHPHRQHATLHRLRSGTSPTRTRTLGEGRTGVTRKCRHPVATIPRYIGGEGRGEPAGDGHCCRPSTPVAVEISSDVPALSTSSSE